MPVVNPDLSLATYDLDDVAYVPERGGFLLRPHVNGVFSAAADLPASAVVTLPALAMPGLTELFCFNIEASIPDGTALEFQVAATQTGSPLAPVWRYWSGTAWAAPTTSAHWNTAATVDLHLPTLLPAYPRALAVRFRLTSNADRDQTPTLRALSFGVEFTHNGYEDARRSLCSFLQSALQIPQTVFLSVPGEEGGTADELELLTDLTPVSVQHVWNVTNDPGRTVDLYNTYIPTGRVLALDAAQDVGDVLEVAFTATCDVYLSQASPGLADPIKIPAVRIETPAQPPHPEYSQGEETTISYQRLLARQRPAPDYTSLEANLYIETPDDLTGDAIARVVDQAFRRYRCGYDPTAEPMMLRRLSPYRRLDSWKRGLFVVHQHLELTFKLHHPFYEEHPLLQRIHFQTRTGRSPSDAFEVS